MLSSYFTETERNLLACSLIGNGKPLSSVEFSFVECPFVASCLVDYGGGNIRKEKIFFNLRTSPKKSEYFGTSTRLLFVGSISTRTN
jgi:hypothetical protein